MRRRNGFDYRTTCPLIDGQISKMQDALTKELKDTIEYLCPHFTDESVEQYVEELSNGFYRAIEDEIEQVRKINADMREAAGNMILPVDMNRWRHSFAAK